MGTEKNLTGPEVTRRAALALAGMAAGAFMCPAGPQDPARPASRPLPAAPTRPAGSPSPPEARKAPPEGRKSLLGPSKRHMCGAVLGAAPHIRQIEGNIPSKRRKCGTALARPPHISNFEGDLLARGPRTAAFATIDPARNLPIGGNPPNRTVFVKDLRPRTCPKLLHDKPVTSSCAW